MVVKNADRRSFIKTSAGVAAASALAGTCSYTNAQEDKTGSKKTGVYNEWDKLTGIVVGNPYKPTLPTMNYVFKEYAGLSDTIKKEIVTHSGKRYDKRHPELWEKVTEQQEGLAKTIEKHGVTVHRVKPLSDEQIQADPVGYWPLYPRDPMLAVGPYLMQLYTRMPLHRKRLWTLGELLSKEAKRTGQRYLSMPEPARKVDLADETQPYLEGGDIFVLDKDILVGHSGLGSSYAGIDWLARFLEPDGYRVHTVELTKEWLHLDCVFATARKGLMMCTLEGVKGGRKGLPKFLNDWELIETTHKEAKTLGCNGVNLAPSVTVIGEEHDRIINELEKKNVQCVTVFYPDASTCGGGPRCSTHPLARQPA